MLVCTAPLGLNVRMVIVHVRGISVIAEVDDSAKFPTEIFESPAQTDSIA
jgi:hypothetical protein